MPRPLQAERRALCDRERVAYDDLLFELWEWQKPIPDNDHVLARIVGKCVRTWREKIRSALQALFDIGADGWSHWTLTRRVRARQNRENANQINDRASLKTKPLFPKDGNRGEGHAARAAPAGPPPDFSHDDREEEERPRRHRERPKACRMTPVAGWAATPADVSYALEQGHTHEWIERQAQEFWHYYSARGNRFVDWSAAWRRWVRREQDYERERANRPGRRSFEERRAAAEQRARENNAMLLRIVRERAERRAREAAA